MDSRKRLYKVTKNAPTLTERVKKSNISRNNTRKNAFNANRKIDLDDSISTPQKPAPIKISQIKDKSQKLKAYIEQKKSAKFKEALETRSPFIPYVPVGRWVEKKEDTKKLKNIAITTPVRKALMNSDKILKKTTIKELATTVKKEISTTSKKELPGVGSKKAESFIKSRKKILVEPNVNEVLAIPINQTGSKNPLPDLNSTFEIIPDVTNNDYNENIQPKNNFQKSPKVEIFNETRKHAVKKAKPKVVAKKKIEPKVVLLKRDVPKKSLKAVVPLKKTTQVKNAVVKAKIAKPVKRPIIPTKVPSPRPQEIIDATSIEPQVTVKPLKELSHTYKFYKSSLDNQRAYLSMQLSDITGNLSSFIDLLPEETQTLIHQNIQQGNRIINEKMENFMEVLEKFENANENDVKRVTEDDVENYWDLLYEEIEKIKEELIFMRETKNFALKENQQKRKRRTTKYDINVTPRRSRRIAEHTDSPNNHSCFGCTPISMSKINTPKSNKKRRTLFKNKELSFD